MLTITNRRIYVINTILLQNISFLGAIAMKSETLDATWQGLGDLLQRYARFNVVETQNCIFEHESKKIKTAHFQLTMFSENDPVNILQIELVHSIQTPLLFLDNPPS